MNDGPHASGVEERPDVLAQSIRDGLDLSRWFREYPLETTLFTLASAVILAKTVRGESALKRPPVQSI